MDFSLIEHHPWATAGIVLGGGFVLYLVLRRGSSGQAATQTTYAAAAADPQTAQLQAQAAAQQTQVQGYIAGLQLQGATQISLAQIGADLGKYQTAATVDVTDFQTAGQVQLGLATLDAATEQARINAGLQGKYIDAIVAAFGGSANTANPATVANPIVTPSSGSPTNPTVQSAPPTYAYVPTPGGTQSYPVGSYNPATIPPGSAPLPGGTELVPRPDYANCNPWDVACVANNQAMNVSWENASVAAQSANNRNQCLANAQLSAGRDNYASLVAACG